MAFVELENKVKSVRNTIDSLIDKVIALKSQVRKVRTFDKEGFKLSDSLEKILEEIHNCQDTVEVITTRIHGMQQNNQYISVSEANKLEQEKYGIKLDFDILAAKYEETYLELIQKSFWANLKDAWQRFINGVTTLTAKILIWSFTGLIRPMIPPKPGGTLPPSRPFWEKIFGS